MYTLARPAQAPYGSSSSAVSQPSTGRPRSARSSFTRPRSPTRPWLTRPSPSRHTTPIDQGPSPRCARDRPDNRIRRLRMQALQLERSANAHERRRARRVCRPSARSCIGATAPSSVVVGATCSLLGTRGAELPDDLLLESPRDLRLDQLAAKRTQQRLRDGRHPYRSKPAECPRRGTEHRVVADEPRKSEWSSSSARSQRRRSGAPRPSPRRSLRCRRAPATHVRARSARRRRAPA